MKSIKYITVAFSLIALLLAYVHGRALWHPHYVAAVGESSVEQTVEALPAAQARSVTATTDAGITGAPTQLALLAFKAEKQLELWAEQNGQWRQLKNYRILAASGGPGPKLREGDRQVPEGLYRVVLLNPNSSYHLALKIDYPNEFDQQKARLDQRTRLGGDICIHGKDVSIGCIAVGDPAIEEIFVLASKVGAQNIKVIIAPNDLRASPAVTPPRPEVSWLAELYQTLKAELRPFTKVAP